MNLSQPLSTALVDLFDDPRPNGGVIGTRTSEGILRKGIDQEKLISIDHGALRIQPLLQPGWQRAALAYGPFQRENGLMLAVALLNGHNASRSSGLTQAFSSRIKRFLLASGVDSMPQRLRRLAGYGRKKRVLRQMLRWALISKNGPGPELLENLALGWYATEVPGCPVTDGSAFVIRSNGGNNGDLCVRSGLQTVKAIGGLQNVPVWLVIILREQGAAYYAASLPGASGLPGLPAMRPLGIDPLGGDASVYASIQQSVLGEIGFHADTRLAGVQVEQAKEYSRWYGSAHAADTLHTLNRYTGQQALAETGGAWQMVALPEAPPEQTLAILDPGQPSGLLHIFLQSAGGLVWRFQDAENYWQVRVDGSGALLECVENGQRKPVGFQPGPLLTPGAQHSLQIVDDGQHFALTLDGCLLFGCEFTDRTFEQASGVGVLASAQDEGTRAAHHFEAHARLVHVPACLQLPGPAWLPAQTSLSRAPAEAWDDFHGEPGPLAGRVLCNGAHVWRHELGGGQFEVQRSGGTLQGNGTLQNNGGVRVCASAQAPNPGRSAYTIAWDHPEAADLQLEISPPGQQRGQGEKGRAGLIFWQDPANYLITSTWLDDSFAGASLSSFFYLDGFENIYDAVWTNVGARITWGKDYCLRTVFDGLLYQVLVNDEPVLYRSLTDVYPDARRLEIRRVGIVANWDWGDDTGSVFRYFEAQAKSTHSTSLLKR